MALRTGQKAQRALLKAGYEAYLVGGCVRDHLLGLKPKDVDLTTNARPEQIKAVFGGLPQSDIGERFGTVGILLDDRWVEITTYRTEQYQTGSRKPQVEFGDSLLEDLSRRDFTINAIAMAVDGTIVDPHDGQRDLDAGVIRAVGTASDRFKEDPLRILRAVRLANQLGFAIDDGTIRGITQKRDSLVTISRERVAEELNKILLTDLPSFGILWLERLSLLPHTVPELEAQIGIHQSPPHHKDVFSHTMLVVDKTPATLRLRWAALLHDIGKPATKSVEGGAVHFYRHEFVGAEMARDLLHTLRFGTDFSKEVSSLVALHMRPNLYDRSFGKSAVRRLVRDAGPLLEDLLALSRDDITSQQAQRVEAALARIDDLEARTKEEEDAVVAVSPLNGEEIMQLTGYGPGPEIGRLKRALTEMVIEGTLTAGDKPGAVARLKDLTSPES